MKSFRHVLVILFSVISLVSFGQSEKERLEKERSRLEKKIAYTQKLIKDTKGAKENTINELVVLRQQIRNREKLIRNLNSETRILDNQITRKQNIINSLEYDLNELKAEYEKMIVAAYKSNNSYNNLLFIFSSSSFNELYTRLKYIDRYAEYRKKQAELIEITQEDLNERIAQLEKKKIKKVKVVRNIIDQKSQLGSEIDNQNDIYADLRKQEKKLKKELNTNRKKKKQLELAIKKAIEQEILAKTGIDMSLSKVFKENIGKLPWPVVKGTITGRYGSQPHPVYPKMTIQNNGIDITTTKGAEARAIFGGTVTNVIFSPSFHKAVLVNHGEYFTVYSNLTNIVVKAGDKISAKQHIGTAYTDESKGKTHVHLELWQGTKTLDPAKWIVN